jgi:hypothetical protein
MERARQSGGILTIPEAALAAQISMEEAQQLLEQMVQRRIVGLSLRENGQKVITFLRRTAQIRQHREWGDSSREHPLPPAPIELK